MGSRKGQKMEQMVVLESRMIENPHTTDALVDAAIAKGEEEPRWIPAAVNLVTTIGGLARIKGLTDAQKAAAARWRSLGEQVQQLGKLKGSDPEVEKVDGGGGGSDIIALASDALRERRILRRKLGDMTAKLLDDVICHDLGLRALARQEGEPDGGSGTMRMRKRVLVAVSDLVHLLATGGQRLRQVGARPETFVGEVSTRRAFRSH